MALFSIIQLRESYKLLIIWTTSIPISLDYQSSTVVITVKRIKNQNNFSLVMGMWWFMILQKCFQIKSVCLADDNQRAVAGGSDGRVYVFDMHSGCLVRTISTSHNASVTGVKVTNNDDFLITAGKLIRSSNHKEDCNAF